MGTTGVRHGHASLDLLTRAPKAAKIERLLNLGERPDSRRVLEVGTGAGAIAHYFATHPTLDFQVEAVDVDDRRRIKERYSFTKVEGTTLPFHNAQFDVVISNHVIEHVGDADAQRHHLDELRRVLKADGIGYLAMPNRWQLVEPHYQLAFLSWLPERFRSPYLRLRRYDREYDCRPLSLSTLESMLSGAGLRFTQQHGRALRLTYELEKPNALAWRCFLRYLPESFYTLLRRGFPTLIYLIWRN